MCLEPTGRFGWRWKFRKVCGKEAVEVVSMGDTAQEREEEVWDPLRETSCGGRACGRDRKEQMEWQKGTPESVVSEKQPGLPVQEGKGLNCRLQGQCF